MKRYKIILFAAIFSMAACNDDEFLKEEPVDIYTENNSYSDPSHIVLTITEMHRLVKAQFDGRLSNTFYYIGTDAFFNARRPVNPITQSAPSVLNPDNIVASIPWDDMYEVIKNANLVLDRVEVVDYPTEELKSRHIAEARFFRGFAYRVLANMYGSVPIVLEVLRESKKDFVRAESRDAVYQQAAEDLVFASENLPEITEVEAIGRISKAAAYHFLSEVYISLQEYDNAIDAANWVINSPNFELMTSRFGRRTDVPGTNVFWDLFQKGNIDWEAGNKETIWAMQFAYGIPGGGDLGHHSTGNFKFERTIPPLYWFAKDPDGENCFLGPTSGNGGRPAGFASPMEHVKYGIWAGDFANDIRNAECNVKRDFTVDNPASAYFGESVNTFKETTDTLWHYHPYWTKCSTINDHPAQAIRDTETGELWAQAGGTYKNWQLARLAETYLLLAEAYLGNGDQANAALAINVVRDRANATPVDPADVDIDYILDERLRELLVEEPRRMTLMRLGKYYERTTKYNPFSGPLIEEHWELFPIPSAQIERNTESDLGQNPGYIN